MYKQRGATVNGYLLTLLVAAGIASAATSLWLATHRTIVLEIKIPVSCRPTVFT